MRRLFLAAGIGLSALTATAQLPPEDWFSSCDGPSATCLTPYIDHLASQFAGGGRFLHKDSHSPCEPVALLLERLTPSANTALRPGAAPDDALAYYEPALLPIADDAEEVLRRWSLASQAHLPVTDAERLRLKYDSPDRSGQELQLVCELQGPVDDAELVRRYDWTVSDDTDAVSLTAIPKDRLERLFYDRFTVTLDAANWRPTTVHFATPGRVGRNAVALRPWIDDDTTTIQMVAFKSPSDTEEPVRTAEASGHEPRLLRDEAAPLLLPPAPAPCEPNTAREPVEAPKP